MMECDRYVCQNKFMISVTHCKMHDEREKTFCSLECKRKHEIEDHSSIDVV